MHVDQNAEVEYLQIFTEHQLNDKPLEITRDHYLPVKNNNVNHHYTVMRAGDVQIGDVLLGGGKVVAIDSVQRRGLYAPVTENGEIQVSGVTASCYIHLLEDVSPVVQAVASHVALAPLRVACAWDFSVCQNEKYTDADGFSTNLLDMIRLGMHFVDLDRGMQPAVLVAGLPILVCFFSLEMLWTHGTLFLAILIFAVGLSSLAIRRRSGQALDLKRKAT
jgi:hypothetical protein